MKYGNFEALYIKIKPPNRTSYQNEVRYIGHIVLVDGIKCDSGKIRSVSDMRSFLGIASYYRKFIQNFSTIAFPLTQLTQKNRKFSLTDDCDAILKQLKETFI